ncbi:SsgA family sporulation/cell division regulator [Streptacidiphilus rugosus]|uniref:SsgA family sporulation/cell division regulator n=1 Tax=Streptacidiphilus rugosus TaxID=405783 RepID=UPI000A01DB89|nr:SsgA family sporulation/cell division regulator [Streptacidiphilus rugosus]
MRTIARTAFTPARGATLFSEIEHHIPLVLIDSSDAGPQLPARFAYRRSDPFAVKLSFPGFVGPGSGDLTWLFARELLDVGLLAPVGDGDIRVAPAGEGAVRLTLRSGTAEAVLEARRDAVVRFLRACRDCVRPGREDEACDWEREWDALLGRELS